MEFHKLVRDRIPEIITHDGEVPVVRILDDDAEYRRALLDKIVEEATELRDSDGDLEERADLQEALLNFDAIAKLSQKAIEAARADKAAERGGFDRRIYLERTEKRQ